MKLLESNLSNLILQMLGADNKIFMLISSKGNIISQTSEAHRLLKQSPLRPVGEVLSQRAYDAVKSVLHTGGQATLGEEIEGQAYSLQICAFGEDALLYFKPLQERTTALPASLSGQIIGSLSHILAAVHLFPNVEQEKQDLLLDDVRRSSLRIYRSLSHLQLLETQDSAEQVLRLKEDSLSALLKRLSEDCQAVCRARSIKTKIRTEIAPGCHVVYDSPMITRAVLGLLTNALRVPGVSTVTLMLHRGRGYVTIAVRNDGRGLPPDALARLYDGWKYPQSMSDMLEQNAAQLPGGLGLPLIRQIAGWHGGALLMENDGESGTVMRLSFPDDLRADDIILAQPSIEESLNITELELSVL